MTSSFLIKATILIFLLAFASCRPGSANTSSDDQTILFLQEFYQGYLGACDKVPLVEEQKIMDDLILKHCTLKLQKQIHDPDIDWDLFIDGQYCMVEWLTTLKISKGKSDGMYVVTFIESPTKKLKTIRLKVVKENGNDKIDEVLR